MLRTIMSTSTTAGGPVKPQGKPIRETINWNMTMRTVVASNLGSTLYRQNPDVRCCHSRGAGCPAAPKCLHECCAARCRGGRGYYSGHWYGLRRYYEQIDRGRKKGANTTTATTREEQESPSSHDDQEP